jgi:hypothetical protein
MSYTDSAFCHYIGILILSAVPTTVEKKGSGYVYFFHDESAMLFWPMSERK